VAALAIGFGMGFWRLTAVALALAGLVLSVVPRVEDWLHNRRS
jgi:uncharacterized membrane protein YhiD involved in acid resistance